MKCDRRMFLGMIGAGVTTPAASSTERDSAKAKLADLVANTFHSGKGRSCSETMLAAGLEYLGEPEELVCMAMPFGGGMHMGDHCGFYCAGLMVIGLACAGRPDGNKLAVRLSKQFTEDWKKKRSLMCRDIRKKQPKGDYTGCGKVGKDAGSVLDGLVRELVDSGQRARFARRR